MEEDGFYTATRIVNPLLVKYRQAIREIYGTKALKKPHNYTYHDDIAIYLQIEELRDQLALNKITKQNFAKKLENLTQKHPETTPKIYEIINEIHKALTGQPLPTPEPPALPAPQPHPEPEMPTPQQPIITGTCPQCAINGDHAEKPLQQCPYCGKLYCHKHVQPHLVMTFAAYQSYIRIHSDIAEQIEEEWRSEDGHPCIQYTQQFWQEYRKRKQQSFFNYRSVKQESRRASKVETPTMSRTKSRKHNRKIRKIALLATIMLILFALSFTDLDSDDLNNAQEILAYRTNPLNNDTDYDGLNDYTEAIKLRTNPLINDTDGDGISDLEEISTYHTDPLSADTDHDKLSDAKEIHIGLNPLINDTDGDLLTDGDEILKYFTDPLNPDTDNDGLTDGTEVTIGTNPKAIDTDYDGLNDTYEIRLGTNPTKNWKKQVDEDAIKSALSKHYRQQISQLAAKLAGATPAETAWNILKWININIEYDYLKAGKTYAELNAPPDTVALRRGICSDYALLTAALLLEAGANRVYIIEIHNTTSGHLAAVVEVNGETYVLDQHLPPIPYENYQHHLISSGLKTITQIKVYEVALDNRGEPVITNTALQNLSRREEKIDNQHIATTVFQIISKHNPQLQLDPKLASGAYKKIKCEKSLVPFQCKIYLPRGYTSGIIYSLKLDPAYISQDFAYYWLSEILEADEDLITNIQKYNRAYIAAETIQIPLLLGGYTTKTIIVIYLANT